MAEIEIQTFKNPEPCNQANEVGVKHPLREALSKPVLWIAMGIPVAGILAMEALPQFSEEIFLAAVSFTVYGVSSQVRAYGSL